MFRSPYYYYRNDITAAITSHILGGFEDGYMKPLPVRQINSYPPESILQIGIGKIVLSTDEHPVLLKDTNVHVVMQYFNVTNAKKTLREKRAK